MSRFDRIFMKACAALFLASACTLLQAAAAEGGSNCSPPAGAATLLARTDVRFLFVGERHGTREMPAVFVQLVCAAVHQKKRVLVGLEFEESSRPAFEKFIASSGSAEDEREFFERAWKLRPNVLPDGRTSEAMLAMVRSLRSLRASGGDIAVTTFKVSVPYTPGGSQTPYEMGMAKSLHSAFEAGSYDLAIVLVGDMHARRERVEIPEVPPFDPMAMHFPRESTLSLRFVHSGGEAWTCQDVCGTHASAGRQNAEVGIRLGGESGYDGIVGIGPVTASPPVAGI